MNDDSTNLRQEFVTELESILESDEAYGSNLQILTYALKEDVINGKFKDSWNNRVYEFIIDIDGISYKPAAKLDSFSADELPIRFDAYSKGYASLFENGRFDRNPVGKRVKKPKCGKQGYGCGYSCISLLKTCQILSSGKKAGTNQGKAIGQQRLNKLMELSKKLYLAGDTKKAALAGVIAANISKVRQGHDISGAERMFERRSIKQLGYNSTESSLFPQKTSVKSQEKQLVKPKSEPTKSTSDPTTNPKTHSIKNQKDFEDVFYHVINELGKKQDDSSSIPIYEIRESIGELVPRNKFNEYLLNLQADDNIILQAGGESGNFGKWLNNSIIPKGNTIRYYVKIEEAGQKQINKLNSIKQDIAEKTLKNRPDLDPLGSARQYVKGKKIASQEEFKGVVEKIINTLSNEFNYQNLVPIPKIRETLKERIVPEDFDKMMIDLQLDDKYQLMSGDTRAMTPKERKESVAMPGGSVRHFIKKL